MNILVVDDFEPNRKLLRAIFSHEGFGVFEAADGADALQVLEREEVAVVVSDILMPKMDGYHLCAKIRGAERLRDLPFIFYTSTYTSPSDEKLALEIGADGFIRKPAPAAVLVAAVGELLAAPRRTHRADVTLPQGFDLTREYTQHLVAKLEEKNEALHRRTKELRETNDKLQAVISSEKKAEEAAVKARDFYRELLADFPAMIWQAGADAKCNYFNRTWLAFTGRALEKELGDGWTQDVHPDDAARLTAEYLQAFNSRMPFELEYRLRRYDGEYREIFAHGRPFNGLEGGFAGYIGSCSDITDRKRAENALRESEHRYRQLVQALPAAVCTCDAEGRITFFNDAAAKLWGREPQIGNDLWCGSWRMFSRDGSPLPHEQCPMAATIRTGRPVRNVEIIVERPDGSRSYVLTHPDPIRDSPGGIIGGVNILVDITARQRAEAALRKREAQLEEAQEVAHVGSWEWDILANTLTWSDELYRIFALKREKFGATDEAFFKLVHPEDVTRVHAAVDDALAGRSPYNLEFRLIRSDGSVRLLHSRGRVTADRMGNPIRMFGVAQDVTERHQTQQELQWANEQLHTLSRRLFQVQEDERRHLAREIHDQLGQTLTAATMNLQTAKHLAEPAEIAHRLDESIAILDQLLDQVREISLDLRPPLLDDLGLVPALRWYFDQQAQRAGFSAEFSADPSLERLGAEIETACFRVAQEALTNIVRHAEADRVTIQLHRAPDALHLIVSDNGVGFDVAAARECANREKKLGLIGMRERVSLLGGELDIKSVPGHGAEIHAFFPVPSGAILPESTP